MKAQRLIPIFLLLACLIFLSGWTVQAAPLNAPQSPGLSNMVACWGMEEASGTRFDSSPNKYDLLEGNTVGSKAGILGNAAEFIALDKDYLRRAHVAGLDATNSTSMYWAGWVYSVSGATGYGTIFSKSSSSAWEYAGYFNAPDNSSHFSISDINTSAGSASLSYYAWHFVEARYDSAGQIIGVAVDNSPWINSTATGLTSYAGDFWVGASPKNGGEGFWNGRIDEVVVYRNRVLTDDERAWLYNNGAGRSCVNEIAIATATPNAPTATLTSTPTGTPSAATATAVYVQAVNAAAQTAVSISIITAPAVITINNDNSNQNKPGSSGGTSSGSSGSGFSAVTPVPVVPQFQGGAQVFMGNSCGGYYIRARVFVDDNKDGMMSPAEGVTGLQIFFLDQNYARLGSAYTVDGQASFCIPPTQYGRLISVDIPYLQKFGKLQIPESPTKDEEIWFPGDPPVLPLFLP